MMAEHTSHSTARALRALLSIAALAALSTRAEPLAAQDPGATSTLLLVAGSVNGQPVSSSQREVVVEAGEPVDGSLQVEINSDWASNAVMAMGVTPTWGDHAASYVTLPAFGTPVAGLLRDVPISFVAPAEAGTYSIIVAFRAEFTAGQVMSSTNWTVGTLIWNNGDDVAGWSQATIETVNTHGTALVDYTVPSGPAQFYTPATAITVVVENGADPYQEFAACSNEIGCSLLLPSSIPIVGATGLALSWCQTAESWKADEYQDAVVSGVLTLIDLAVFLGGDALPSISSAFDCLEILFDAYYDDILARGEDWAEAARDAIATIEELLPSSLDWSAERWLSRIIHQFWVFSPVTLTIVDEGGSVLSIDADGTPVSGLSDPALPFSYGDLEKTALVVGGVGSTYEVVLEGTPEASGDTFDFTYIDSIEDESRVFEFRSVSINPSGLASLTVGDPSVDLQLRVDRNGDGTVDEVVGPTFVSGVLQGALQTRPRRIRSPSAQSLLVRLALPEGFSPELVEPSSILLLSELAPLSAIPQGQVMQLRFDQEAVYDLLVERTGRTRGKADLTITAFWDGFLLEARGTVTLGGDKRARRR